MVVDARVVLRFLVAMVVLLVLLHLVINWVHHNQQGPMSGNGRARTAFSLDEEISVPTWWAQLLLAAAAGLCVPIAVVERQRRSPAGVGWAIVGLGLLALSIDEGVALHEQLIGPIRSALNITGGVFITAWVIPALPALPLVGALLFRGWRRLPSPARRWTLAGGLCLVAGAVGVEMIGVWWLNYRAEDFAYSCFVALEEGLEMLGSSFVIYGLLTALRLRLGEESFAVRVVDRPVG